MSAYGFNTFQSGAYTAIDSVHKGDKIVFNVCSKLHLTQNEILSNHIPKSCIGSAACLVRGINGYPLGKLSEPLKIVDNNR